MKNKSNLRECRECGCTDQQACPGGCHWVEEDLCSQCADKSEKNCDCADCAGFFVPDLIFEFNIDPVYEESKDKKWKRYKFISQLKLHINIIKYKIKKLCSKQPNA